MIWIGPSLCRVVSRVQHMYTYTAHLASKLRPRLHELGGVRYESKILQSLTRTKLLASDDRLTLQQRLLLLQQTYMMSISAGGTRTNAGHTMNV